MPIALSKSASIIRYASITIFIISLACPCFDTEEEANVIHQGANLFLMGIFWFMLASPGVIWLANPLLFISWLTLEKKPDRSFITSILAILIAMCFLFYKHIVQNEGGASKTLITSHRIGYWLWLISILTMVLGNFCLQVFRSTAKRV